MNREALEASKRSLQGASRVNLQLQQIRRAVHPKRAMLDKHLQQRLVLETRWEVALKPISDALFNALDFPDAITFAQQGWTPVRKSLWERLVRAMRDPPRASDGTSAAGAAAAPAATDLFTPPSAQALTERIATVAAAPIEVAAGNGVVAYVGMTIPTSEQAGQATLEQLGLNRTFAWAHPRAMANDLFGVRGSKVIQGMYGEHLNALAKIIIEATDPRHPLTIQEVMQLIREQWPELQQWQIERIARTETASVWSSTAVNAYRANGIEFYESVLAKTNYEVDSMGACDMCQLQAAAGVKLLGVDTPPWHPNCRCEIVPVLEDPDTGEVWLPPAEPFTGGDLPVERAATPIPVLRPAPAPGEPSGGGEYTVRTGSKEVRAALRTQVKRWWAFHDSRLRALRIIRRLPPEAKLYTYEDTDAVPLSVAGVAPGSSYWHVSGVSARLGGALALVREIATRAHKAGAGLTVAAEITPQLRTSLIDAGFEDDDGVLRLVRSGLQSAFALPVDAPEPPPATL